MTTLERLGLVLMLYGVALHSWHDVVATVVSLAALLGGAALLIAGGPLERWLRKSWPGVPW
jgi:hypothetical protein